MPLTVIRSGSPPAHALTFVAVRALPGMDTAQMTPRPPIFVDPVGDPALPCHAMPRRVEPSLAMPKSEFTEIRALPVGFSRMSCRFCVRAALSGR